MQGEYGFQQFMSLYVDVFHVEQVLFPAHRAQRASRFFDLEKVKDEECLYQDLLYFLLPVTLHVWMH